MVWNIPWGPAGTVRGQPGAERRASSLTGLLSPQVMVYYANTF